MIEDLSVDCGIVRVRTKSVTPPQQIPPIPPLFVLGIASIFGFILLSRGQYIPITTGKLGGKMVGVKLKSRI